jgi:hypothetical protein
MHTFKAFCGDLEGCLSIIQIKSFNQLKLRSYKAFGATASASIALPWLMALSEVIPWAVRALPFLQVGALMRNPGGSAHEPLRWLCTINRSNPCASCAVRS